jgi:hypothetical protein
MKRSLSICALSLILVQACGRTDGAAGPAGSQGPAGPPGPAKALRLLDDRIGGWLPKNRDRLNALLVEKGIASASYDPKNRPVAAFDWDNTMVKNDCGDATFFWMIQHDKILQPAGRDWGTTSAYLTPAAKAALNAACDAAAAPGAPIPTSATPACADEVFAIYDGGKTMGGADAWLNAITLTQNQPYAWVGELQAGYTPEEIRQMSRAAFDANAWASAGALQTVGTNKKVTGWVRIYEQMHDLVGALQDNGFDVWVTTASPQFVIEPIAEMVGVSADHVLGIRTVVVNGVTTAARQGCGTIADGPTAPITFDEGKRCWINKVIFHEPAASQMARNPDPARRPVFSAGDSDTDIAFVKDATTLKLAINRNKTQLMCNAYANYQDRWLVQPMFLSPKGARTTPYPCSSTKDAAGVLIVDEAGSAMADAPDVIYALP